MLPVYDESHQFVVYIYSSTIAAIITFIIGLILSCNLLYVYFTIQKNKASQKPAYLLVLAYLILVTIASFSYAFIRTNVLTRIDITQFTTYQCVTGYMLSYCAFYLSTGLLYIIFVWRIHITFAQSAYAYNTSILYTIGSVITIVIFLLLAQLSWALLGAEWAILEHETVSICFNNAYEYNQVLKYSYMYLGIFTAAFHFIVSIILLFMFIKGLWSINKMLIKSFVANNNKLQQNNRKITIGSVLDHRLEQPQSTHTSRHILILYDLAKRQTILVSISMASSVTLWVLCAVNDWISLEIYWDVIINAICAWLMLGSSKGYWKFCTKSFFRCCYRKENEIRKRSSAIIKK